MNGSRGSQGQPLSVVVGALGVTLWLAACHVSGSPEGPTAPRFSATARSICSDTGALSRLRVHRTDALPRNGLQFSFPGDDVVVNDMAVQAVAVAACALPTMPSGPISCPADQGISYLLTFAADTVTLPSLTVSAGGCQQVDGLSGTRWTPGPLWNALGRALHLTPPYDQDFRGRPPG